VADTEVTEDDAPLDSQPVPPTIDGHSAAAILLMLLDDAEASAIIAHLAPDEVKSLGKAMLGVTHVGEAQVESALDRFVGQTRQATTLGHDAAPRVRAVMTQALGNVRADNLLAAIAPGGTAVALDMLRWMDAATISGILASEHPQFGALILASLTPEMAAEALSELPEARQSDLVYRAARLSEVPAEALEDLETVLRQHSEARTASTNVKLGGASDVARIMNNVRKASGARIIKSLAKIDKGLSQQVEDEMFVFDNLNDLDDKALGTLLRGVDSETLVVALKGADTSLADRMLGCMSARAAQSIRDDMADRGKVKRADVQEAQKLVLNTARALADDGTITLGNQGDDYV
jgi:flagellar motor switch protein FliG